MAVDYAQETNMEKILISNVVFLVVSPLLVATRLWSHTRKEGKIGPSDWMLLAALAFSLAHGAVLVDACRYGYGRHSDTLSTADRNYALYLFYHSQWLYKACINLTKTSLLLLYMRIFSHVKWFRWTCISLIVIVNVYCVISVMLTIVQCIPIALAWDRDVAGNCINNGVFWFANAGFSIITDLCILVIPMPLVRKLQIPKIQKMALVMVFMLGAFVVITSCLRITTIDLMAKTPDKTYDIASTMWTSIELNVSIVCACLPQIRPLIVKMFPKLMPNAYSEERTGGHSPWSSPWSNSGFSKAFSSPVKSSAESRWPQQEGRDAIQLGSIRRPETSSEEYILSDDKTPPTLNIQKTVRYSVEYTKDRPSLQQ